jgi:hypothetical protein
MPTDDTRRAIDEAANALQTAVLLVTQLTADHEELRRAVTRAARSLAAAIKPATPDR